MCRVERALDPVPYTVVSLYASTLLPLNLPFKYILAEVLILATTRKSVYVEGMELKFIDVAEPPRVVVAILSYVIGIVIP